ncbi:MAG: hypothetical protein EXS31_08935 [Pedosphaera sp.]|nr:hypothetical protein [Pedosphaera sp.]
MKTLKKLAVLIEEFALQTPSQQLLDRFLIGYPRNGEFHRLDGCAVSVYLPNDERNVELDRRVKDFGLHREQNLSAATSNADAVLLLPKGSGAMPDDLFLRETLENVPRGCCCFTYGAMSSSLAEARKTTALASARKCPFVGGTSLPVAWRLPQLEIPIGTALKEALIVVQGNSPAAELDGLEGLLPLLQRRRGGESGVRRVRLLNASEIWRAGKEGLWSERLLSAAISRSDTPQGDPVKDGRTQDLVGLGLVPKLARAPRGWIIEHFDGLRSAILVLDGVVADFNFALQARDGSVLSAQIYRPPAPSQHHFSRLADGLEEFFRTGIPPWPIERNLLTAGLLEAFRKCHAQIEARLETPQLKISYSTKRH